jgi:RimJ/RimL family protein N-acetyltransferase
VITIRPAAIQTDRLALLPLQVEHADEMAAVLGDPALHTFIGGEPETLDALRARYQRWSDGSPYPDQAWCNWVISIRDEGVLTGTVQATVTADERGYVAEISWVVGTPWQGRGIAREAAQGLVGRLRDVPVHTVVAHIHPDHKASASVAAAAGLAATEQWEDGEVRWEARLG